MADISNNGSRATRRAIRGILAVAVVIAVIFLVRGLFLHSDPAVRAVRATRQDLVTSVTTNGKIEPIQNFEAHSPGPTTVRKILVPQGAPAKAGQLLMQLDDSDARTAAAKASADLAAAQAQLDAVKRGGSQVEVLSTTADLAKAQNELDAARQDLSKLQKLQTIGAATPAEVQAARNRVTVAQQQVDFLNSKKTNRYSHLDISQAEAQVRQAQAAYNAAADMVNKANIRAPFNGTVYYIPLHESEFANTGELLLQLADLSKLQVRAFVDEPEIGHLKTGDLVSVQWDALPGQSWAGQVTQVPTSIVSYGTRNVGQVLCMIDNRDASLIPNVNVTVNITTSRQKDVIAVPREAIHLEGAERFVYIVQEGKLKRTSVQIGASNLTMTEITGGLGEGTEVALGATNSQPLRDGMPVHIQQ